MVAQNQIGSNISFRFPDKRKTISASADSNCHISTGAIAFTANAGGTTTTIVGANATPSTNTNVIRVGEKFRLFASSGIVKQETVFTVTVIAVAGSTTVTFTPAAAVATASTDYAELTGTQDIDDQSSLEERLFQLSSTSYSLARLSQMTQNDMLFALRSLADADGV